MFMYEGPELEDWFYIMDDTLNNPATDFSNFVGTYNLRVEANN